MSIKIPTAEEFIKSTELVVKYDDTQGCVLEEELRHVLINFAKLHVEAALKAASEKAVVHADEGGYSEFVDEQSILQSYLLTNIK